MVRGTTGKANPRASLPYQHRLDILKEFLARLDGVAAQARELRATRRRARDSMSFDELEEHRRTLVHCRADAEALAAEWDSLRGTQL